MWKRIKAYVGGIELGMSLWGQLFGAGGILTAGVLTGWAAWATEPLKTYAPLSYILSGLIGLLLASLFVHFLARSRAKIAEAALATSEAAFLAKRADAPQSVNPLLDVYEKRRIRLEDFRHPLRPSLNVGKRFIDCEIFGPAVILLRDKTYISPMHLSICDMIHIALPNSIYNVIVFEDCQFIGCQFYQITFLIDDNLKEEIDRQFPVPWLNKPNPALTPATPSSPSSAQRTSSGSRLG